MAEALDRAISDHHKQNGTAHNESMSLQGTPPAKTAHAMAYSTSSLDQQHSHDRSISPQKTKVYGSVAEMKRSKVR